MKESTTTTTRATTRRGSRQSPASSVARFRHLLGATLPMALLGATLPLPSIASAQSLVGLGFYAGTRSEGEGVNGDGSIAVGTSGSVLIPAAFQWRNGFVRNLSFLPPTLGSHGRAVSADGSTSVGHAWFPGAKNAMWWRYTNQEISLFRLPGWTDSTAAGVSGDGFLVVGRCERPIAPPVERTIAWRWTLSEGMVSLGYLPGGSSSDALGVSADGSTIVGQSDSLEGVRAFRWDRINGMQSLGVMIDGTYSSANAVNTDGRVIVGTGDTTADTPGRAFRWTRRTGPVSLGIAVPFASSTYSATGVSADGSVIVGNILETSGGSRAFLWNRRIGVVPLTTYLTELGVDLSGWTALSMANGMSADGRAIVGTGIHNGRTEGFLATVPRFCPADIDDGTASGTPDGGVTTDDLLYYLDQYSAGNTRADIDDGSTTATPDGGVTIDDLLYYLQRFEAGC